MKFKQLREKITPEQIRQLKKFYEPLRKVDMSKHKGQIDKTTAKLRRLNPMSLLQLSKQDIPIVSDVAKSILGKMNPKMSTEETVDESLVVGLNKSSAEYKAGKDAAKKGIKYDDNPHAPGVKRLNWSTGHNDFRADSLRKAGKPNYGARGQFEDTEIDEGTWHIAKDITKLKNTMKKPMPYSEYGFDFVAKYIGDDELWDDLGVLKKGQDMVPAIKKAMKRLGIKEEVELNEWDVTWINNIGNKMASRNLSSYTTAKMLATQLKSQGAKQIEISEANLSKAQIKKVHDKADELPKHDFIKRYGKDGDAVRFATATKQVKKELGIGEVITGRGSSRSSSGTSYDSGGEPQPITLPVGLEKGTGNKSLSKRILDKIKNAVITFGEEDIGIEEVELTEAVSDSYVKQIARMTDRNDHFGARIELARMMKDKQLMGFYDSLEKMHTTSQVSNAIGNDAVNLRGKLEKVLKFRLKNRFGDKDANRLMRAL